MRVFDAAAASAAVIVCPTLSSASTSTTSPPRLQSVPVLTHDEGSSTHLSTVFSCGSRWTSAQTCGVLCPSGDSSICPNGELCYAGISCVMSQRDMEDVLEEQRHLEREEVNRLIDIRGDENVDRFVCGQSYEDAMSSCVTSADPPQRHPQLGWGSSAAHYCPMGSSSVCPANEQCYAAVPCPKATHEPEISVLDMVEMGLSLPKVVTEPMLMNFSGSEVTEVISLEINVNTESIQGWSSWMIGS